jgi:hypothetical protein
MNPHVPPDIIDDFYVIAAWAWWKYVIAALYLIFFIFFVN